MQLPHWGRNCLHKPIRICDCKVHRLVLTHKDRLLRFGVELIFTLCETRQVEIVIINQGDDISFEEELAKDVLEIITVFSACQLEMDRDLNAARCSEQLINTGSSLEIQACGQDGSVIMLKMCLQPAWKKQELSPV